MQTKRKQQEMLDAAELLLSVSPMFKPQQQTRDRSWSLQSLETLVDVAARAPRFSIGPSATAASGASADPSRWKAAKPARDTPTGLAHHGRSLLQTAPHASQGFAALAAPSVSAAVSAGTIKGTPAATAAAFKSGNRAQKKQKLQASNVNATTFGAYSRAPGPVAAMVCSNPHCASSKRAFCSTCNVCSGAAARQSLLGHQVPIKKPRAKTASKATKKRHNLPARRCPDILPLEMHSIYYRQGRTGVYTAAERKAMIAKFLQKREKRVWHKKVRYSCRRNLAHKRIRVKGRFVKTEEPAVLAPEESV
ncbi:Two-component response regulator-like APRR9 [Hondaea fermentalgiana]|uniref:Two-component response regulator-like APRR9 n=1 Tax=Hondaea fermentalgiana TaxID=2315210 RepID=A0A2R5GRN5_9STRA|nr:Two-component response regulator-like APRR9 [Hondaea fermentalgiana]|eukprot:GBG32969.1 Two-component response regulator-like APRR9 [Hondaea fermentalgiana]